MHQNNELPRGSFFYNLVYWLVRLRAGFIALILILTTLFMYQYWQNLSQNPLSLVAKVQTDIMILSVNMPEKFISNNNGITAGIKLLTQSTEQKVLDTDNVIVDFSSNDPNLNFEPKQLVLSKLELEKKENQYIIKATSQSRLDTKKVELKLVLTNPDQTKISIQKSLSLESQFKNLVVFISGLLAFLTAVLSFISLARSLISTS